MPTVWDEIETTLIQLYSLRHNQLDLAEKRLNPSVAAKKKVNEIRSGIAGVPTREDFSGPKLFLRVAGLANRAYSGEWWFEASLLDHLNKAYSRIYFQSVDRKAAIRDILRELLAVSKEWNTFADVWALELPPGEKLVGYTGPGTPQRLFQALPLSDKANRMLVGRAKQIFFPMKNPLWVRVYEHLPM